MRTSLFLVLFILFFIFLGCKGKDQDLESVVAEVEKKETELKEVGVPKFLLEEQKSLETNTNVLESKDIDQFFDSQTNFIPTKVVARNVRKTNVIVEEKVEPEEMISTETQVIHPYIKPKKKEKVSKSISGRTSFVSLKIYFSYMNNKRYIDKKNPGKITSVIYVDGNIWYVDFDVYAIPYSSVTKYERMLKSKYLIGVGRNISVVDNRSQLTVYWSGLNLNKRYLPNGKYAVVVKTKLKNAKKSVVSTYTKILGMDNPLVIILAN